VERILINPSFIPSNEADATEVSTSKNNIVYFLKSMMIVAKNTLVRNVSVFVENCREKEKDREKDQEREKEREREKEKESRYRRSEREERSEIKMRSYGC